MCKGLDELRVEEECEVGPFGSHAHNHPANPCSICNGTGKTYRPLTEQEKEELIQMAVGFYIAWFKQQYESIGKVFESITLHSGVTVVKK